MAFTRATGKHRAPSRLTRRGAQAAGIAALATTGVLGSLASPAAAADSEAPKTAESGLTQAIALDATLAQQIEAQAQAQHQQAEALAKAKAKAAAEAKVKAAKAKAKAEAQRKAEARAEEIREEKARAARAAERARLNAFHLPVAGSHVTTGYKTGGSLWSSGSHSGVDFMAASGSSVVAVGAGTVVEAGWGGAYGNNIVLRMTDGTYTQYGHLSSIGVSVGQSVTSGQQIGLSGSTGNSTGPHLHFEARTTPEYGSDMDPVGYLRSHGLNV
ncbi:M23 family metallopeptidase [Streptomyces microflavus]|uniref:M23 family metallopeptidase n=1 Tax=Streptomyces microflavus TaxID=1919 RepID=A0A6N9VJP6_STRMI|nr:MULTISPECIES: M23 family metallopeptidase [Streptomyces]MBK3585520.1 M23 family metallopeptidase [Streptomyces sp. MBT57]MEE1728663.1 M23 family metallopeptidase [Streptomyces sp. BE282]NEB71488.1 M23 family metallopeptidase [Streptomyces microflavus]QKW45935.1 M23 family metallopeptidase [Streptomyces microflavus]QQZ56963.1 M23 family metallopeptidase [Streptomyces microflavus]